MYTRPTLFRLPRGAAAILLLLATPLSAYSAGAQEPGEESSDPTEGADFRVYDRAGSPSSLAAVLTAASRAEVLLVGEEHDDMPGHAFEALLFERAFEPHVVGDRPVVLSLEMFERDVQYVIDEYLRGEITEAHFLRSSRPWDDYEERYRPLVETAKDRGAPVVAANAPRRYVNRVTREGPESLADLSAQARSYLPPLPYPGPSDRYRAQWDAIMAEAMAGQGGPAPEEATRGYSGASNAIYSQALWDASMGHAVTEALVENLGALVVHFAGSFHVEKETGIPERIQDYRPGTRVTTVVITKADGIDSWSDEEHADLADFVVLTQRPPEDDPPIGSP